MDYSEISDGGVLSSGSIEPSQESFFLPNGSILCSGTAIVSTLQLRGLYVTGLNDYGQVGDGTTTNRYKPEFINSSYTKFSTGLRHCLAINNSKELYAWGQNLNGRLGDETETDRYTPTRIGVASNWEQVVASWNFSLAINSDGELYSWGNNIAGNLGYDPRSDVLTPTLVGTVTTYKVTVAAGTNGFGAGNKFYLNGKVSPAITLKKGKIYRFDQSDVSNVNHPFKFSATSNGTHASGTAYTTEVQVFGTAGTNDSYVEITVLEETPNLYYYCQNHSGMGGAAQVVADSGETWEKIAAGRHVLAINSLGELHSWGENEFGQLGDGLSGGTTSRSTVTKIGSASNWVEIAAGYDHTLVINSDGELWACGRNDYGQVGDGTQTNRSELAQIGIATNWVKVAAGRDHSLAINSDGELYSWGRNQISYSQLGLGDETESVRTSPTLVTGLTDLIDVRAGFHHSVVLDSHGDIYGFGFNGYGNLGDGTSATRSSPVLLDYIENVSQIEAGGYLTLAFVASNNTEYALGGINVSGSSLFSSGVPIDGGATLSGEAISKFVLEINDSAAVFLNGSAGVYYIVYETVQSSGTACSGEAFVGRTLTETMSGGATSAGSSVVGVSLVARGGATSGGTAFVSLITTATASGQTKLNGNSDHFSITSWEMIEGIAAGGRGVIGIQPKVGGTILTGGSSPELKIILPEIGLGSLIVYGDQASINLIYNIEKYKRGQARMSGRARKERLITLTKTIVRNVGLALESPNILNIPPVDPNKIIVPKGAQTPELDPNSFRFMHYPGWCEFGDTCASAYVPDVVKKRQGKYMPEKVSTEVVQPGVQLTTKS